MFEVLHIGDFILSENTKMEDLEALSDNHFFFVKNRTRRTGYHSKQFWFCEPTEIDGVKAYVEVDCVQETNQLYVTLHLLYGAVEVNPLSCGAFIKLRDILKSKNAELLLSKECFYHFRELRTNKYYLRYHIEDYDPMYDWGYRSCHEKYDLVNNILRELTGQKNEEIGFEDTKSYGSYWKTYEFETIRISNHMWAHPRDGGWYHEVIIDLINR